MTKNNIAVTLDDRFFAGEHDPLIPEYWAQESLAILEESVTAAGRVHRDFENIIQSSGDVVNTRRPSEFRAIRKNADDEVTTQDASATNVQVPLNQHLHTSIVLKDEDVSKSFQDLTQFYLRPKVVAIARAIDRIVLGQAARFAFINRAGGLEATPGVATINRLGRIMDDNKVPETDRDLFISPTTKEALMNLSTFHEADKVGDQGTALRTASLGQKLGFNIFSALNIPRYDIGGRTMNEDTTLSANAAKGATTIVVADATGAATGRMLAIEGQGVYIICGVSSTTLTVYPALDAAAASGDDVFIYGGAGHKVNQNSSSKAVGGTGSVTGYRAGWHGWVIYDTNVTVPNIGQLLTFGATADASAAALQAKYTIIDVDSTNSKVLLDRPLDAAVADNADINLGPSGEVNFAFNRNAIALVNRPLALPRTNSGAQGYVATFNNLSMRAVIAYDAKAQGHRITIDTLMGVQVLDEDLGAVLFG